MFLPLALVYYLIAFFIYVLLYGYYKKTNQKTIARLDFLQRLESTPLPLAPIAIRKPFNQIKKEISANFYFDRIRILFAIDLSASNEWQGRKTFQGQSLHKTNANKIFNPYQKAISQLGVIFEDLFSSNKIEYSCFGFGDQQSKDYFFFPIVGTGEESNNYQRVLHAYLEQIKTSVLSGPTSFTPVIEKLISCGIHYPKDFTMLIILTDEFKISNEDKSLVASIRVLTSLPNLCLIVIGIGDGPWQRMSYEEHCLRELTFKKINKKKIEKLHGKIGQSKIIYDNFHFVDFNSFTTKSDKNDHENHFARAVLTKLPTQLKQAFKNNHVTF